MFSEMAKLIFLSNRSLSTFFWLFSFIYFCVSSVCTIKLHQMQDRCEHQQFVYRIQILSGFALYNIDKLIIKKHRGVQSLTTFPRCFSQEVQCTISFLLGRNTITCSLPKNKKNMMALLSTPIINTVCTFCFYIWKQSISQHANFHFRCKLLLSY